MAREEELLLWVEVEVDEKKGAGRGVAFKEGEETDEEEEAEEAAGGDEAEEGVLSLASLLTLSASRRSSPPPLSLSISVLSAH